MLIPVMHCFDDNYVVPAAVAFFSMLENADPNHDYALYVLHSDISDLHKGKLKKTIEQFTNATLTFIDMEDKFSGLFTDTVHKGHYTQEMFYKFLAPSIFPQYDKIIIADVDVVYLGDVSREFIAFDVSDEVYFAGCQGLCLEGSWVHKYLVDEYRDDFSPEEIDKLTTGAGYYIFNLNKMRKDGTQDRFIDLAISNSHRIRQPEQDVISLVCHPYIKLLSPNSVVCGFHYEMFSKIEDAKHDLHYSEAQVRDALSNPIQLHFATNVKPWNDISCTRSEVWHSYLFRTEFARGYLDQLKSASKENKAVNPFRTILKFKIPLSRKVVLSIEDMQRT